MTPALAVADGGIASSVILVWIGRALLYGTALAGITWLLTRMLHRRVHPAVETLLWSIVLLKFLAPVGPSWSLSLANLCERMSVRINAPGHTAPTGANPVSAAWPCTATTSAIAGQHLHQDGSGTAGQSWRWTTLLTWAYLAGVVTLMGVRTWSYRLLLARCRGLPPANEATRDLVSDVCRRLDVRRVPAVRISDESPAPFVIGFLRPLLVLSHRHLVRPDELETVVVHEVAHLRRGDMFVRYLQWIAGTVLFFWPVVAWVNRRIDVAREYTCDEWALRHGRLTAGEYARCLLNALQPMQPCRLAYHPSSMATNQTTLERRIDMILESTRRPSNRHKWGLLTIAFLFAWSGFALSGAAGARQPANADDQTWPPTEEAVKEHAIQLYNLVAEHEAADFNGNGELTYLEKDVFLVALAMETSEAFMEEFPYADRNHSERLDFLEVYGVIRAITRIAYLDRRIGAEIDAVSDRDSDQGRERIRQIHLKYDPEGLRLLHEGLDAQKWLLDNMTTEPSAEDLDNIWSVLRRIQGPPNMYSMRMLNHGGPAQSRKGSKCGSGDYSRFHELEGNIASIEAKLAGEKDPKEAAKLQAMLTKLETILANLEGA
jgi:beta-lactamase regulating signal transducer with metallopeptidase domain